MEIRTIRPEDKDFVFDSWFKSWRKNEYAGTIPNDKYYEVMLALVEGLVGRGAEIHVAAVGDTILGWVCHEVTGDGFAVVHYLYVKERYEKKEFNVVPALMEKVKGQKPGFVTHKIRLPGSWRHAPEIARRIKA
jgi:hypothetical protein